MENRTTHVLLVDDDPANLDSLEDVLAPLGQQLVRAESGRDALRCAEEEDFAVILLDVRMGDLSGLDVLRQLRERERNRRTPVLLMTAADLGTEELLEGYAHGAVDYLLKPLIPQMLRAKVTTFVELQLARDQLRRQEAAQRELERERWAAEQSGRLHALLLQAPVGICIQRGPDFIYEFANPFYAQMMGRSIVPGRSLRELFPEVDLQPEVLERMRRVLETGESFVGTEYPITLQRGKGGAPEVVLFDFVYQAIREADESITGVLCFCVEVTGQVRERRQSEQLSEELRSRTQELRESEERLRLALASTSLGTWDYNLVTQEIAWDARCKQLVGVAPDVPAVPGLLFQRMHPGDRERVAEAMRRSMDPAGSGDYVMEYRHAESREDDERWLRATGRVHFDQGRAVRFIGTVQDISERKRAERQTRERAEQALQSEVQLRSLANSLPQLVWISAPDGQATWFNERFYEHTGLTPEKIRGEGWHAFHMQEELARLTVTWTQALAAGRRWEEQLRIKGADGQWRWFLSRAIPVRDAAGHIVQWLGTHTDIDEARRMLEDLRQAQEEIRHLNAGLEDRVRERTTQLQLANQELESFSYSVSHDLRAPLRHILGFAQLLERRAGPMLDDTARGLLKTISNAARDGGILIDELLEFSRMSRTELRQTRVDLHALVGEVRHGLEPDMKGRHLEWRVAALPTVQADPLLLRQVLRNLLGNALKYTRPRDPALIEVGAREEAGEVQVWVRDNGVGFDMSHVDKLFGVFQRLHTAEQFEGTGIGLANVRRIISRHGGRTWAESTVGQGATFHFTLPRAAS